MKYLFKKQVFVTAILLALVFALSCTKYKNAVIKTQYLDNNIPIYDSFLNENDNASIHLGRVLFYDKNLSVNNATACASCHKQELAFADNVAKSVGFENRLTKRNSIAIQNISNFPIFGQTILFWDGRESLLSSLISKPIANHIEMGMDNEQELLNKLNALPYIKTLVNKAYGNNEMLTMERLSNSMSIFLSRINSLNSKFDIFNNFGQTIQLKGLEYNGFQLFQTTYQCNSCHQISSLGIYNSNGFANIGLEVNPSDKGRMNISNDEWDLGAFKIPDLHNVALTDPYMHDGRFKTLNEVLAHYSHGIQQSANLDSRLQNVDGSPKKLNITEEDKTAIIAFLNTLTDYTVLSNPLLSNPFKNK